MGITSHEAHVKKIVFFLIWDISLSLIWGISKSKTILKGKNELVPQGTWGVAQSRHIANDGWLMPFTRFLESKEHVCLVDT